MVQHFLASIPMFKWMEQYFPVEEEEELMVGSLVEKETLPRKIPLLLLSESIVLLALFFVS